jgi:ABC-2 type transport system permease protein
MRGFWIRTLALAHKEVLHMLRDPQFVWLALGMPLLMVLLFGYAVSFDVQDVPVAALDLDRTPSSRQLLSRVDASEAIEIVHRVERMPEIDALLRTGAVKGALIVERGYARHLVRGEAGVVQLVVDGADGTTAQTVLGDVTALGQAITLEAWARRGVAPAISPRIRTWFNPNMRSALFVVPGIVAVVLAIILVLLSTLTVAREWERGSMEQLFATPVGRLSVVLGKVLPYVGLGLVQLLLVMILGVQLFDVPVRGNPLVLLGASVLFMVCALGQGLLISMITKSQQVATQIGAVSAILPSLLLSGFLFPIENMPTPLRLISNVVPARHYIVVLRGVLLQGRGVEVLWPSLAALAALGLFFVAVTTLRFQRRLA